MPIFMDRHDLGEPVSPQDLAKAHYEDLLIQDQYGINTMTYWHSHDRTTSFCLIDAPDAESLKAMHGAAHGSVPGEVIEVDPGMVEAILGRTVDPVPVESMDTYDKNLDEYAEAHDDAFRVIMFTDLKDSTQMNVELGQDKALELLQTHNNIVRKAIQAYNGSEVKHTGDGFMISFLSVDDALAAACGIQDAFHKYNQEHPGEQMFVRIGVAAGEPVLESNDFFGLTVNLASRLSDLAEPGGVLISSDVYEIGRETEFNFEELGTASLKGFAEPVQVYKVSF